jgi:hypothetical protein
MNVLDENILKDQRQQLLRWRMRVYQIGYEVGRKGMVDEEIIPLLHQLRHPTFFTLDSDFYQRQLCHAGYCLVCIDAGQTQAAFFVRRLLRHRAFNTHVKRMGAVIRVSHTGIFVWRMRADKEVFIEWES